jgi:hypothetical protein
MPIGSRNQSDPDGVTVSFVFSRRLQTGSVGSRTLSGNAVGGVTRHKGANPPPSGFPLQYKEFRQCQLSARIAPTCDCGPIEAQRLGLSAQRNRGQERMPV